MNNKFKITFAWICNHEEYGEIVSFLVSPKVLICPNTYGYNLSKALDEVIRFPANHPKALSILNRMAKINSTQWSEPSYDLVEEEFDLDDFFEELIYQNNYGREVTFHTYHGCL